MGLLYYIRLKSDEGSKPLQGSCRNEVIVDPVVHETHPVEANYQGYTYDAINTRDLVGSRNIEKLIKER